MEEGIIPSRLKIKKKPAFQPVSEDFEAKWNSTLYNAERNIVELLPFEAEKVITKIQVEIQVQVNEKNPEKFERKYAGWKGSILIFTGSWIRDAGRSGKKLRKEI